MLDSLRSATQTWVVKLFLGLLVMSFAVWGIADAFRTDHSGSAALTAGGSEVSASDYRFAYEQQMMRLSQQFRQRLTKEQGQALGVENQVLAQLAAGVVLDEEARQMNLGISKDGIARLTAQDTAFHDASGRFSAAQFDAVLRQAGIRPQDYLDNRAQVARRQQIVDALTDGIKVPDAMLKALALYEGESRTVDYIAFEPEKMDAIPAPSDDVLKTYFEAHKAEYSAPEYRKITYVKLEASDVADKSSVMQDEIQDYFDKNKDRYTTAETRNIEQLSFADEAAAKAAHDKIVAGTSFDDLAREQGKSAEDIQLGSFEKSAIPDQALADAAFTLAEGSVSDVINGAFGPVLLRVTKITPEHTKTLAEVEDEIRSTIALTLAGNAITGLHDQFEEERSNGLTLAETAEKLNLKPVTVEAVDTEGNDPAGNPVAAMPLQPQLISMSFETDQGFDNDALSLGNNGYVWYQVDGITPARERTLDEVKDRLIEAWKGEEAAKRLMARVEDFKKRLDGGETLDALATELGTEKMTKRGITRTSNDSELGSAAVAQVFRGPDGLTGTAPAASNDAQILFKVTEAVEPAGVSPETIAPERQQSFATALSDDLLAQLVGELQKQYPVKINQAAVNAAMAF